MRRRSFRNGRLGIPLAVALLAGSATAQTTPNLLENPGAEEGSTFPWGTSDGSQEGPLTVGAAVLDATEGTRWFVADEHIVVNQTGGIGYLIHYLGQEVDLSALGPIQGLTLRGDFFGAGEVLAGAASSVAWQAELFVTFLDENGQAFDGTSFTSDPAPLAPLQTFDDLLFEIAPVPAATAAVQVQYSSSLQVVVGEAGTLPFEVRIAIGIDDLSLTATVPEPASGAAGLTAAATLGLLQLRARPRQRRAARG